MKKVFLAVLCAGLFFACGNKKQAEPEALVDTVPVEEVIQDVAEEVVEEPVSDEEPRFTVAHIRPLPISTPYRP